MTDDDTRPRRNLRVVQGQTSRAPDPPVKGYLQQTERALRGLKRDLDRYRDQCGTLQKERDDQRRRLEGNESDRQNRSALEGELEFVKRERGRLAASAEPLEAENQALRQRCTELERLLAEAKERANEAREIIWYLEAQIEQMECISAMVKEHNRFMKPEGD